jgi:hypothetical protein
MTITIDGSGPVTGVNTLDFSGTAAKITGYYSAIHKSPVPAGGVVPDVTYTATAPSEYTGGETKFGPWRQYHNVAEWGWGMTYNTKLDPYTVYPPTFAARDVFNTTASGCAAMRIDMAEGSSGQNFWSMEFAPLAATATVPDWGASTQYFLFDSGLMRIRAGLSEAAFELRTNNSGVRKTWLTRVNAAGHYLIQDTTANVKVIPSEADGTTWLDISPTTGNVGLGAVAGYGSKLWLQNGASAQVSLGMQNPGQGTGQIGFLTTGPTFYVRNCYADGLLANGSGLAVDTTSVTVENQLNVNKSIRSSVALTTTGNYSIDSSTAYTVANGASIDFPTFSGLIVINNHTNGWIGVYICGGGGAPTTVSTIGTGPAMTMSFVSAIGGYRATNAYGSTANFGIFTVRTRSAA